MAETDRFSNCTEWIDLGLVERERTHHELILIGFRHNLPGLLLSNIVILLEGSGHSVLGSGAFWKEFRDGTLSKGIEITGLIDSTPLLGRAR